MMPFQDIERQRYCRGHAEKVFTEKTVSTMFKDQELKFRSNALASLAQDKRARSEM